MTDKDLIEKICKFAFVFAIIGICTLGICPAFAFMSIAVCVVLKNKKVELTQECIKKLRISKILSIISLILFVVDIFSAYYFTQT